MNEACIIFDQIFYTEIAIVRNQIKATTVVKGQSMNWNCWNRIVCSFYALVLLAYSIDASGS